MATSGVGRGAMGRATSTRDLFVRNATGLVRSWATFDAFIYSFFSINLVTLGWYIFSSGPITQGNGNLVTAIVISSILMLAEVVIYAGLIAVMPRAGGDYVWQTRVLGGGLGSVLAVKGNAYAQTVAAAGKAGFKPVPFTSAALAPSMALIPLVLFFNLWPNWGATLYGEVRGANDFRRNLRAMSLSVVVTAILAVVSLGLIAKVMTSGFYNDA